MVSAIACTSGRSGGLMVNALDFGSIIPSLSPGIYGGHCVVFLDKTFTLSVPLSTQVYKGVPANLMLGVTLRWTGIPFKGE